MTGSSKSNEKRTRKSARPTLIVKDLVGGPSSMRRLLLKISEEARRERFDLTGADLELVVRGIAVGETEKPALRFTLGKLIEYDRERLKKIGDARRKKLAEKDRQRAKLLESSRRAKSQVEINTSGESTLDRALSAARKRGQIRAAEILAGEDMLSGDAFGSQVGATRATVNTWRQAGRVLGLSGAKRGYRYPAWQIGQDGKPFEVLPQLHEIFGGGAWAVYRFLVQPHPELDGATGSEALTRGDAQRVVEAAESVAQGFG